MKTHAVYAIPKEGDMTEGRGQEIFCGSEIDCDDYALRNDSPDNPDEYEVRARSGFLVYRIGTGELVDFIPSNKIGRNRVDMEMGLARKIDFDRFYVSDTEVPDQ